MSNPLDEALPYEKCAINALVAVFLVVFLGVGLDWASVDNPVSDALNQYFLDPIRGESTGDSGYNSVNTATYAVVLGLFVVALSAWLRRLGIDPSDTSLLALLPFGRSSLSALSSAMPTAPASTTQDAAWKCIPGLTK